jgi:hypothetical protein
MVRRLREQRASNATPVIAQGGQHETWFIAVGIAGLVLAVGLAACNLNVDEDDLDALFEACCKMTLEDGSDEVGGTGAEHGHVLKI